MGEHVSVVSTFANKNLAASSLACVQTCRRVFDCANQSAWCFDNSWVDGNADVGVIHIPESERLSYWKGRNDFRRATSEATRGRRLVIARESMTRVNSDRAALSLAAQDKDHFVCDLQPEGAHSDSKSSISLRVLFPEHPLRDGDIARNFVTAAERGLSRMHVGKTPVAILERGSEVASFGQTATQKIEPSNDVLESIDKVIKCVDAVAKVVKAVSEVGVKFNAASIDSGVG